MEKLTSREPSRRAFCVSFRNGSLLTQYGAPTLFHYFIWQVDAVAAIVKGHTCIVSTSMSLSAKRVPGPLYLREMLINTCNNCFVLDNIKGSRDGQAAAAQLLARKHRQESGHKNSGLVEGISSGSEAYTPCAD